MARMKELNWTADLDRLIRVKIQAGIPKAKIAKEIGIHRCQLLRRIKVLGITEDNLFDPVLSETPSHLKDYKRARRGFYVPTDVEPAYYNLLKQGVPIEEARKILKIKKDKR